MPLVDYSTLIDAETWAFIHESESWFPPDAATYSIERQRDIYDAMCRAFHRGYPDGVSAADLPLDGVPCRIYECDNLTFTLIYFHGGGFVVGGLQSHDDICAEICKITHARVVSVDYRLAPEYRHPAHFNDALCATRAVAARFGGPLVLAGDSAGGNLAAAVAHATRDEGLELRGQVLIYPGLGGDRTKGSYVVHANAPLLTREDDDYYARTRFENDIEPERDETSAPLRDHDFTRLPPTLIVTAECDPTCDDGANYAEKIRRAGGHAHLRLEKGLVHGYLRARHSVARAAVSFQAICDGIAALGRGEIPWRGAL